MEKSSNASCPSPSGESYDAHHHLRTSPSERVTVTKGTLTYALESCDEKLLNAALSRTDVDRREALLVMTAVKRSRELCRHSFTALQAAASFGLLSICRHLVEDGAQLVSTTSIPHPLCIALEKGHREIARFLIASGADVNKTFEDKQPLRFALSHDRCPVDIVRDIIEAGFPVNGVVFLVSGETALHTAVNMNNTEVVKYLLTLPVDINQSEKRGLTALHYAVQKSHLSVAKLLIMAGAMINCECMENITPLFYAIIKGNYEMVKLLIELGADIHHVNGKQEFSMMPLQFAANYLQLKITQLLLELGANVNLANPVTGEIALHSAARAGVEVGNSARNKVSLNCIVELLIKYGSNLEARHKYGLTPLQAAIKARNINVAKSLIMNGANLNSTINESGGRCYTSFHLVSKTLDKELITLSLDYGADYMSKDNLDLYPCHFALITSMVDALPLPEDCPQYQPPAHREQLMLSVFKLFWKHGFPFNLTMEIQHLKPIPSFPTILADAVQKQNMLFNGLKAQNIKMVQKAIAQGAEVKCCSIELPSPLHFIAARGDEQILKEFVTRGVKVNTLNKFGETALHLAARAGHLNCCRLLLEHGAVYNALNKAKPPKTPLDLAKRSNHTGVVSLLVTVDKYFKEIKKGNFKKLKPHMKNFVSVMNCCHRDGNTLMGRALHLGLMNSAERLMKLRLRMV